MANIEARNHPGLVSGKAASIKPRDLVFDTLELSSPKRVPRDLWMLPWATNNYPQKVKMIQERFPNDFGGPPVHYAKPIQTTGDPYK